jgi:predicted nucleic acid-binding protein
MTEENLMEVNTDKSRVANDTDQRGGLRILPDSSWLVAILDSKDTHHVSALSSFGALAPYKPVFYLPALVYLETLSRLIRVNKLPVKKCADKISRFLDKVECRYSRELEIAEIIRKYKTFSRVKISKLHPLDFYIATEGIVLDAKILTCDLRMFNYVSRYYKKIYFMTDRVREKGSDLSALIKDIQLGR